MSDNLQQQQEGARSSTTSPSFDGWDGGSRGSLEPVSLELFEGGSASASGGDYRYNEGFMAATATFVADTAVDGASAEAVEEAVAEVVYMDEPLSQKREAVEVPAFTRRRKKPKGMPKRSLSAYNLYFQRERQKIMDQQQSTKKLSGSSTGLSFEELGKMIGKRWRELSAADREEYEGLASQDSVRYRKQMEVFNEEKKKRILHIDEDSKPDAMSVFALTTNVNAPLPFLRLPHQEPHRTSMKHHAAMGAPHASPPDRLGPPPLHSHDDQQRHPSYPSSDRYPPPPYPPVASAYSPMSRFPAVDIHGSRSGGSMPPPYYEPPADGQHDRSDGPGGRPSPASRSSSATYPPPMPSSMDHHQQQQFNDSLFPIPPGMELMLPDRDGRERKFRVEYACYTMTREAAQDYIDRLSGALSHHSTPPHPPPPHRRAGGTEEGVASSSSGYGRGAGAAPPQLSPGNNR